VTTRIKKTTRKKTTKAIPKKRSKGRPSEYDPKYIDTVLEYMSQGYSKEATAGAIGISKQTMYNWMQEYKDFMDAVLEGEVKSQLAWEKKAVDYSVHTKDGKRLDSRIYALQMKNRFGWSDKKEISVDEETRKTFNFKLDIKPEEIK
jgi:transposase